jgi:hypothetical protein
MPLPRLAALALSATDGELVIPWAWHWSREAGARPAAIASALFVPTARATYYRLLEAYADEDEEVAVESFTWLARHPAFTQIDADRVTELVERNPKGWRIAAAMLEVLDTRELASTRLAEQLEDVMGVRSGGYHERSQD